MKHRFFSKYLFVFALLFTAHISTASALSYGDIVSLYSMGDKGQNCYFVGYNIIKWIGYGESNNPEEDNGYALAARPDNSALGWRIVNGNNPNQTGPVRYGDTIGLQAVGEIYLPQSSIGTCYYRGNNKYLSCDGDGYGSLRVDRTGLLANEQWVIFNASNQNDRSEVGNGANVGFRSHWGRFLTCEPDKRVHADRGGLASWETWRINKK